ncbi:MAG TPA: flagellar hook-length control protein FliK, partial [Paraburkholderia sp.]|nr:flagellar hook-length control protein FliK [Paraburkholderia sp.]
SKAAGTAATLGDAKGNKGEQAAAATPSTADALASKAAVDTLAATGTSTTSTSADSQAAQQSASDSATAALVASQAAAASAAATNVAQTGNPAAAAAAAANTIAPQVGTSDWEDELGQKVVFLSNAHQQSAELTLNPKDLGPLQVVLQVADNHAHALFVSQHAQVREAVEAALPKLREAMESNGIGLGSASVSDGFAQQTGQQAQQQSSRSGSGSAGGTGTDDDAATATVVDAPTRQTVGLVDTFA